MYSKGGSMPLFLSHVYFWHTFDLLGISLCMAEMFFFSKIAVLTNKFPTEAKTLATRRAVSQPMQASLSAKPMG